MRGKKWGAPEVAELKALPESLADAALRVGRTAAAAQSQRTQIYGQMIALVGHDAAAVALGISSDELTAQLSDDPRAARGKGAADPRINEVLAEVRALRAEMADMLAEVRALRAEMAEVLHALRGTKADGARSSPPGYNTWTG